MKIKYISLAMLATMFAASCSNEQIVETNADPTGEAIDFRPSVASQTRAEITTIGNLGDFNVYAKGIHVNSGSLFTPFLIGDNTTRKPGIAKRGTVTGNSGKWTLTSNVYWPSDIDKALFWAFTDLKEKESVPESGLCVNGVVKFEDAAGPSIENYTPTKEDLNKVVTNDQGWYDGDNQRDLVSAFCQQTKDPHVTLGFHHLLSQIEVTASSKRLSDDKNNSRIVTIKGAWVVNLAPYGTLKSGFDYDKKSQEATDSPSWDAVTDANKLQSYGTYYVGDREVPVIVQNSTTTPLNALGIGGRGNLMLIPQTMESWDGTSSTTTGAYLLLLCRVELQHTGAVTVEPGEPIYSPNDGTGYHYHQLFPVIDKYDKTAYGLTAIPIPVNWEIGKKYTYNLNMCGENTGAGKYPPNVPTDANELKEYLKKFIPGTAGTDYEINVTDKSDPNKTNIITTIPEKKGVGDYVLDDAIDFTVTVSDWETGDTWTNGDDPKANAASEE